DKAVWTATSGVNMKNFSAAAAPAAGSIDDIIDALQSLATYASEFFSSVLRDLIDTLVTFAKFRLRQMKWDQADLVLLVYWINSILESFRIELEAETSDGSRIKLRCSEEDADFRQILIHIQQRQIRELQAALSTPHSKRLPNGKRLCLRFLSNAGCRSNNGKSCLSAKRAHFVPGSLNPLVKDLITERFGGLKPEHASL
ncbi:hypothetical protein PHYSODRAFT_496236, partial [Phytophthora sojae]